MNKRAELTKRIRQTKLIGGDLTDIITKGSPSMGWEGDPFLMVCWSKQLNRIEYGMKGTELVRKPLSALLLLILHLILIKWCSIS